MDAPVPKARAGAPGYRQIAEALVREIAGGRWIVGECLPSEMTLVERFGVGRNTVREALRELAGRGYIERRRGARSVLRSATPEDGFVNSVRSVEQLIDYATFGHATLLTSETVRLDAALAQRLDNTPGTEWVRVGILRRREEGEDPFCYSEIYLDPRYQDIVPLIGEETRLFPLIEEHHGVVLRRVLQDTEAAAADANIASRLNIPAGTPILLVRTRFYSGDGALVETGLSHFPCGRYRVRIALERPA
ncbi:GntR family transcriptional regulator [Alsobacter sp. SYSU M60028]|uniref:GntR family transcriptional regulator n=1 Tax=Alsobacter ponti TaxID=2962936 RepID=A0ABT1LFT0_9HYPH|nr:GntR family transcriptional regulator [Alsobacter ponti]MCP8939973.1 GntR family transcriptional regulator [Alsobacter ponti]